MEFPDGFPDKGELVLIALLESDGRLNTRELRQSIQALDRDQINYRVRRLRELDLVATKRQGEDKRGQPRPKLVWLTDAGDELASTASEELRYQIEISDGTIGISDEELQAIMDALNDLNDRVSQLEATTDRHREVINQACLDIYQLSEVIGEKVEFADSVDSIPICQGWVLDDDNGYKMCPNLPSSESSLCLRCRLGDHAMPDDGAPFG